MMRPDTGFILAEMGYQNLVDYVASPTELVWLSTAAPKPSDAAIDAAAVPAYRAHRLKAINAECQSRIFARYPMAKQLSAVAGIYPPAYKATMDAFIAAHIEASNVATDAVDAAQTEATVLAVTVNWPVL